MKGVIPLCLKEMVETRFGKEKWKDILKHAELPIDLKILPIDDVDDEVVLRTISSTCSVLNISSEEAARAFGDYWVSVYSQRLYGFYYEGVDSAKDFLLKMDDVHKRSTATIKNARPPRFTYEEKEDGSLVMKYSSPRGLLNIMIGLIYGVGNYFKENLEVEKVDDNAVVVKFKGHR